ncbi:13228_t:CDS:2, partial [Gigaspora margarita]
IFIYLQAIVNFHIGVRTNQPLLRNAARHQFVSIWSARRHPIYKLIEISYEETLLNLKPQISTEYSIVHLSPNDTQDSVNHNPEGYLDHLSYG